MALFKLKNTAAGALPNPARPIVQPGPTTVHNHGTGWVGIIAISFVCVVVALVLAWFALGFLFAQIGSRNPYRDAAYLVLYSSLGIGFLCLMNWQAGSYFDKWLNFKLEVERETTRRVEANLLQAQTTLEPARYTEADYDFARVVISVMANAYNWLEKEEYTAFPGRWRPWSLSSSKKTADEIGVKISQDKANEVSKWLHERGVITDPVNGQITKKFPNLTNVKVLLDNEFGPGVIRQVSPTIRQNRGFKFTD